MKTNSFYSINMFLKEKFNTKVIKLSLDGGFTCPNRDGLLDNRGCIFCSESGSGDFTSGRNNSISNQLHSQIKLLKNKWPNAKYISYFQNFTNTYANTQVLKKLYDEALDFDDVVGLAIATRPDCINDEVLELLKYYNKKTFLWVELGLQTIHNETAEFIRRFYDLDQYDTIMKKLNDNNIKVVTHLIVNLPNENDNKMLESIKYVCNSNTWGIKLQMLNIIKNTDLASYYKKILFI